MDKIRVVKILVAAGLVLSSILLVYYELGVSRYYETHPETLNNAIESIENYSRSTGCVSRKSLFLNTEYGYLESWYLLSTATKRHEMFLYPRGICPNQYQIS